MRVTVQSPNLQRLITVLGSGKVVSTEMHLAFQRAGIIVTNRAKKLAPVDRGRLRASITYQVDPAIFPKWAEVGTNTEYAPDIHDGRPPGTMPPVSELAGWAKRKGLDAWAVAKGIEERGTRPNPFLRRALDDTERQIVEQFDNALERMVNQWGN